MRGRVTVSPFIADVLAAFVLGVLTPLTAVCVLPLYPAFLSYLASTFSPGHRKKKNDKNSIALFGVIVSLGVIAFMSLVGLVFTTILQVSLTNVIGIISPLAFVVLLIISVLLIFDIDVSKYAPHLQAPRVKNTFLRAFLFGFFFGAIVIPCNPLFIAALFTRAITVIGFVTNVLTFIAFGFGISAPLLAFSFISLNQSKHIILFVTKYKTIINRGAGIIMFLISLYYLIFVFRIHTVFGVGL
ncbi:cytochrome C biogenesis protein [archaeon CG10_big_fil_rev_8_21_14_0_10_43_11]|nr:MAG: cytochrome C biogenesis protein [archaeon CG10_big_fil_rev_8_21_14_0_10_43_11]